MKWPNFFCGNIQVSGLQQKYNIDFDFSLNFKLFPALAFVLNDDFLIGFEEIVSKLKFIKPEIKTLYSYFEKNYVGRKNIREPLFAHTIWNCYDSVVARLPRTNNAVEGWHNQSHHMALHKSNKRPTGCWRSK